MAEIYKGPGNSSDYEHSLDMLNEVFFADDEEPRINFLKLLPKLYKAEYNHCENNLIVTEDGEWKGAVGLYFDNVDCAGNKLICGGIGNVAVTKDCRGKGYMQDCMKMAMDLMIEKDADYSVLGGQRQRYEYFSFEPAGAKHYFTFSKPNLKHIFGNDYKPQLSATEVHADDKENIAFIKKLYESKPDKFLRPDEKFYDYLKSWCHRPFVFKDNDSPVGYCVYDTEMNSVSEIKAISTEYFKKLLPDSFVLSKQTELNYEIPLFEKDYIQYLSDIAEGHSFSHSASLTVLNWKKFIKAHFDLKATYTDFCDGSMSFNIHGYKQDEQFTITIKDNKITFSDEVVNPMDLSHKEAIGLFFSLYSDKIYELKPNIAQWFPLHWYVHPSDKV